MRGTQENENTAGTRGQAESCAWDLSHSDCRRDYGKKGKTELSLTSVIWWPRSQLWGHAMARGLALGFVSVWGTRCWQARWQSGPAIMSETDLSFCCQPSDTQSCRKCRQRLWGAGLETVGGEREMTYPWAQVQVNTMLDLQCLPAYPWERLQT